MNFVLLTYQPFCTLVCTMYVKLLNMIFPLIKLMLCRSSLLSTNTKNMEITEYEDEIEMLNQCSPQHKSTISNINFELDASCIAQVGLFPFLTLFI
jgi:hypothetical protein